MIDTHDITSLVHDIRNVLTPALLSTERIATMHAGNGKRYTDEILKAIYKTVEMCESTMARSASCLPTCDNETCISRVLSDAIKVATSQRGASVCASLQSVDELLIGLDGDLLWRIVFNLVRNAANALRDQSDGCIWVDARADSGWLTVLIKDNGPGIPEPVMERFHRANETCSVPYGRTSGLGLPTAARMASKMGGELVLKASCSEGTEFTLHLPHDRLPTNARTKSSHILAANNEFRERKADHGLVIPATCGVV